VSENTVGLWVPSVVPEILPRPLPPIKEFALELQGSCNFGCSDCYMYQGSNAANRTTHKPFEITTARQLAHRIVEYADSYADYDDPAYHLDHASFVLHGGEPLLRMQDVNEVVKTLRDGLSDIKLSFVVQTNGSTLKEGVLAELAELDIGVGVSIDGMPEDHNRSRPLLGGGPSFDRIAENITRMREGWPKLFRGILCTMNKYNMEPPSPEDAERYGCHTKAIPTFRALEQFRPGLEQFPDDPNAFLNFKFDFIWPHANWDNPPPLWDPTGRSTPYADYMIELYEHLFETQAITYTRIRLLDAIARGVMNRLGPYKSPAGGEIFGFGDARYLFIEQDGEIRGTDGLKAWHPNADSIRFGRDGSANVFTHSLREVQEHPVVQLGIREPRRLSTTCQQCEIVDICGGGRASDRQQGGLPDISLGDWGQRAIDEAFKNPSVYCHDYKKLIGYVLTKASSLSYG